MKIAIASMAAWLAACVAPAEPGPPTAREDEAALAATGDGPVTSASNVCGLPTQAHASSIWIPPSYEDCHTCTNLVFTLNTQYGLHDYCTYHPSNGKTDHHRDN